MINKKTINELMGEIKKGIIDLLEMDFWGGNLIYNAKYFEALKKLKHYNEKGFEYLKENSYESIFKTDFWKSAKEVLFDIKTGFRECMLHCYFCKEEIPYNIKTPLNLTLHHIKYNRRELFTPDYVSFAHNNCHEQSHKKLLGEQK